MSRSASKSIAAIAVALLASVSTASAIANNYTGNDYDNPSSGWLSGTNGPDTFDMKGGADSIRGLESGDEANMGDGGDRADGGDGFDDIGGGPGSDLLAGGDGDDSIEGGNASDGITGEKKDDGLHGEDGDDFVDGSDGALGHSDGVFGGSGAHDICAVNYWVDEGRVIDDSGLSGCDALELHYIYGQPV